MHSRRMRESASMSDVSTTEWGRIDEDGTVWLRTADGERPIGSWQAGSREAGLRYYQRRYDDTVAGVDVLEQRLGADADPKEIGDLARRAREALPEAKILGDVAALDARLAALEERADAHIEGRRAARAEARAQATAAKQALVEEAERLAGSTDWKAAGDRIRGIVEDWKAIRGADRAAEQELWQRYAAARDEFNRRRGEHFANLDKQRKAVVARKEEIIAEATTLAESSDWGKTTARYRDLLSDWKAAGRADKASEETLWARFRAAQDAFFARRNAANAERDASLKQNIAAKEALLAQAEAIDPRKDVAGAQRRLREILDKWGKAGRVPREDVDRLEKRLEVVQQRIREAADARWQAKRRDLSSSPLVVRLRESIDKLEARAERARAAGDAKALAEAEASLRTQRQWLAQAERG
jgi:Domain of Unknown Function (DUF349)